MLNSGRGFHLLAGTRDMEPRQEVLSRLRRIIGEASRGCDCRVTLDDVLDRHAALEVARLRSVELRETRRAKATIIAVLELLAEVDEVSDVESDGSVFREFADLFETIACEANTAAARMRRLEGM